MDQHARPADRAEQRETRGHDPAQMPLVQADEEFERHRPVELALPRLPRGEMHWHLGHPQPLGRGGQDVEQHLEPDPRQARGKRAQPRGLHREEPAHRVAQLDPGEHPREPVGQPRSAFAPRAGQAIRARPLGKAGGDHQVHRAAAQVFEHVRDQRGVVLQIGIHHRHHGRGGGARALDHRRGKSAPADPLDDPDLAVVERDLAQRIGGTVGAVVVDEDRFPAQFRQFRVELFDQRDDIVALVERGQDDRDFKHSGVTPNGRKVRQSAPAAPAADRARP